MRKVNYTKHIGLLITEKTYRQLAKITNEKEMSHSQFIRDVLEEKLDQAEEGTVQ
jgi:hypothetical protein